MDGLLISGGADLHPERYGAPGRGSTTVEPDRDALEAEAWEVAQAHGPSRSSASVAGSRRSTSSPAAPSSSTSTATRVRAGARARRSSIRCVSRPARGWRGSSSRRTAAVASSGSTRTTTRPCVGSDLAPGLVANAWASSPAGDLIEGLEAADGRFVFGLQCHPERTESTPARVRAAVRASSWTRREGRPTGADPRRRRLEPAGLDDPLEELARPGLGRVGEDAVRRALLDDPCRRRGSRPDRRCHGRSPSRGWR